MDRIVGEDPQNPEGLISKARGETSEARLLSVDRSSTPHFRAAQADCFQELCCIHSWPQLLLLLTDPVSGSSREDCAASLSPGIWPQE